MFRRILSAIVALGIAAPSASAVDEGVYFRYKMPAADSPVPPDYEYLAGNDIQAWFVAPVGFPFAKEIPVATRDVSNWTKDEGAIPEGISVDTSTGLVSGTAEREETVRSVWHGASASGDRIARADIRFSTFEPVGEVTRVDWYTHTGEYFYRQVPSPAGVEVVRWELVSGELPKEMSLRNGAFEGRPSKAGSYWLALRGYDYLDREVAFTWGEFLVQDGPVVEPIADQIADKGLGQIFNLKADVRHAIGALSYSLVPVSARPAGLTFKSDTGELKGVYQSFDTSADFVIEVRDSGSGKIGRSNEFTLTTAPEAIDLSQMEDLFGYVGTPFERRIARGSDAVRFSVTQGDLPAGLSIDDEKGAIVGIPTEIETETGIVIMASGVGVTEQSSSPFSFRILSGRMSATTTPVHVRIETPFLTEVPTVLEGVDPPYAYQSTTDLPPGLLFDAEHGQFQSSGLPTAGNYDQMFRITNESGWSLMLGQVIRAYNPVTLSYSPQTLHRLTRSAIEPGTAENSIMPSSVFSVSQGQLPAFMSIDAATGIIHADPTQMSHIGEYGPFVVTHTDGTGAPPVISNEFRITVEDRPPLEIVQLSQDVARWVGDHPTNFVAENVYQGVTFSLKSKGNLPETLGINVNGRLSGHTTDPVGTVYSGIVLHAIDGVGYEDELAVSLTVVNPKNIAPISGSGSLDADYAWTVGRDFKGLMLPRVSNTYGKLIYQFLGDAHGLSIDPDTFALTGRVSDVGAFSVPYSITDETGRPPVQGTATFVIQPPMNVSAQAVDAPRGLLMSYAPLRSYGIAPFKWSVESGTLPGTLSFPSMTFDNGTGRISGKPRVEQTYPLTLKVIDATGQEERVSFAITVGEPLPFIFNYGEGWGTLGILSGAAPVLSNASEKILWKHVSGHVPDGFTFHEDGYFAGHFRGYPQEDGLFENILIKGTDTGTGEEYTANVTLRVTRAYAVGYSPASFKHRAGDRVGRFAYPATNVTLPARYEVGASPYSSNVSVDPATGDISVAFPAPGKFTVPLTVTDLFGRTRTSSMVFDVVGDLSLTAPEAMTFKRYSQGYQPLTVKNLIGTGSYAASSMPAGLTAADASVSGTPEATAELADVTITLTDSYDGAATTSNAFSLNVAERDSLQTAMADIDTNQYRNISATPSVEHAIGAVSFGIVPDLPAGLSFDGLTGRITGSVDDVFDGSFTITATDSKGGALGTAASMFHLKAAERLLPDVVNGGSIPALLNHDFKHTLNPKDVYGSVTWEHVGGTLPAGIVFDPVTHAFVGRPTTYGATHGIVIRISDDHKGVVTSADRTISIDVRQDGSAIEVSVPEEIGFRVGHPARSTAPVASNTIGDVVWSATGLEGTGLSVDPATGEIFGSASHPAEITISLIASDITGRNRGRNSRLVMKPAINVAFDRNANLLFNYTFEDLASIGNPVAQPSVANTYGSVSWAISPAGTLPAGLSFNTATGRFDGKPLQLGLYGPFTITATDSLPGSGSLSGVMLHVEMNDDPIDLSVEAYVTKIGYPISTPAAVYDNALGRARFFPENNDLAGTSLVLNEDTGSLSGSFSTPQDRSINIAVTDEYTSRVTSKPLRLQVLPKLALTGPQTVILEAQSPNPDVIVTPTNVAGALAWEELPAAQTAILPEGIIFNSSTGRFTGVSDEIGIFGPFAVSATDTFPAGSDRATSNQIMLDIRPGSSYLSLRPATLPPATRRLGYSFDFRDHLEAVGIDREGLSWTRSPVDPTKPALPAGLNIVNGVLSGTPTETGTFRFDLRVSGAGKSSTRTYELVVGVPDTSIALAPPPVSLDQYESLSLDLKQYTDVVNVPYDKLAWTLTDEEGVAIPGASITGGVIKWRPLVAGDQLFKVTAVFDDGVERVVGTADIPVTVGPAQNLGAHRYWRFYADKVGNGDGSPANNNQTVNLAEIEFRVNGVDVNSVGTFTASCCYAGSYPVSWALDKNWNSFWHSPSPSEAKDRMFTVDFGANPQAIDGVYIVLRAPTYGQAPVLFEVHYSDDNVTWHTGWVEERLHWPTRDYITTRK